MHLFLTRKIFAVSQKPLPDIGIASWMERV